MGAEPSPRELAEALVAGDRRALARAITLVQSRRPTDREPSLDLLDALPDTPDDAHRVGICGPPGVGKSSLIEALGRHWLDAGERLAVLAIDPRSPVSGGSLLGDATRMEELSRHPDAFVRPSPSAGDSSGLGRGTRESVLLCEAAGFSRVLLETVGVGQAEDRVRGLVDTLVLLVQPGAGDEIQGLKRGLLELADLVVVTKADGDLAAEAERAVSEHRQALALTSSPRSGWERPLLSVSAHEARGLGALADGLAEHRTHLAATGRLAAGRSEQAVSALRFDLREALWERFLTPERRAALDRLSTEVASGSLSPGRAVARLLESDESAESR
ncbi:MAG: methylmalonyl Co-A mutase-associated GTPase MeaB [Acidobacteriota bacterium]